VDTTEQHRLNSIAGVSMYASGVNSETIRYSFKIAQRYLVGDNILELGAAEGVMTELLISTGKELTVVEGADTFCQNLRKRYPEITVVHSLFEEFQPTQLYDNIILGHVLEHVKNPELVLTLAKRWLKPDRGIIFAAVPNGRSLHRQAGVIMGLLKSEYDLNDADIHHGHRIVFSPESFRNIFYRAGLMIKVFGGYWMKPVSNRQIEESWTPEMLDAFMQLGERYPDIAGEIYIVASIGE